VIELGQQVWQIEEQEIKKKWKVKKLCSFLKLQ
jgi:hypothetical protein